MITLKTIDAHVAGAPLRLVVEGFPAPRGRTMMDRREWSSSHADHLRQALMREPRGHRDMCGAFLTEPVTPGSHAGLLFMENDGYDTMSAHGVIAATAIALERRLLVPGGEGKTIVYDTPAGTVRARVSDDVSSGHSVTVQNVPSFVVSGGLAIPLDGPGQRTIRADLAYGGAFYAIVDSEAAGLGVDAAHLPELRRIGSAIARSIDESRRIEHPQDARQSGLAGTVFTGPPSSELADLRCVSVGRSGQVDRSPSGTGMSAVMAVLTAMGLLVDGQSVTMEGLIGTTLLGRTAGRTNVGDAEAVVPEIQGTAWITGEHVFYLADDDPLGGGFRI